MCHLLYKNIEKIDRNLEFCSSCMYCGNNWEHKAALFFPMTLHRKLYQWDTLQLMHGWIISSLQQTYCVVCSVLSRSVHFFPAPSHKGVLLSIKLVHQSVFNLTVVVFQPFQVHKRANVRCYPWSKSCSSVCDRSMHPELLHCLLLCGYCQTLSERFGWHRVASWQRLNANVMSPV